MVNSELFKLANRLNNQVYGSKHGCIEKYEMYMKLKKSELVKMLIACNTIIDKIGPKVSIPICPAGYYPNSQSTGMECVHCGRPKSAH